MQSLQTTRPDSYVPLRVQCKHSSPMPICRYDPWCTRPECIYQHTKTKIPPTRTVCLKYLQGQCVFGHDCWYLHPADPQQTLIKLRAQPCQYGARCPYGEQCLFGHLRSSAQSTETYSKRSESSNYPKHAVLRKRQGCQVSYQPSHQPPLLESHPKTVHPRGRSV